MGWPKSLKFFCKMSKTPYITKQELETNDITEAKYGKLRQRKIETGVIDLRWFFLNSQNFFTFSRRLNNLPNSFYSSNFVKYLLEKFWTRAQMKIIKQQFLGQIATITKSAISSKRSSSRTLGKRGCKAAR